MKLKSAIKYQLYNVKKAVMGFYIVIYALIILSSTDFVRIGGLEFATIIFIFILGLNWFKESFKILIQNGVSRLTQYKAMTISAVILATGLSIIDVINRLICTNFDIYESGVNDVNNINELLAHIYPGYSLNRFSPSSLLFQISIYMLAAFLGLFITGLYARMNKGGRMAVSISLPAFFMIGVPLLYEEYNIRIFDPIAKLFSIIFGISPYLDSLILVLISGILIGLVYLLTRKITVE
jgi:hypothetical protein